MATKTLAWYEEPLFLASMVGSGLGAVFAGEALATWLQSPLGYVIAVAAGLASFAFDVKDYRSNIIDKQLKQKSKDDTEKEEMSTRKKLGYGLFAFILAGLSALASGIKRYFKVNKVGK
jgi:hypothetical protein